MKRNDFVRFFPLYFFIFFTIFLSVKFIFIFFFRAAYEPHFLFDLTPFHALAGFNRLQLLTLSLIVVLFNTYLHFNASKKHLFYSLFLTALLLAGLGLSMTTTEFSHDLIIHYVLFSMFLVILLIDHRHTLVFPKELARPEKHLSVAMPSTQKPLHVRQAPKSTRRPSISSMSPVFSLFKPTKTSPKSIDNAVPATTTPPVSKPSYEPPIKYTKAQTPYPYKPITKNKLKDLDRKLKKFHQWNDEIERRKKQSANAEKLYGTQEISLKPDGVHKTECQQNPDRHHHPLLDELHSCAAVVQRGFLIETTDEFTHLLGYDEDELLRKNLLDVISAKGLMEISRYYLDRLNGIDSANYNIVFVTKNNDDVVATVTFKQTIIDGGKADILIIKKR